MDLSIEWKMHRQSWQSSNWRQIWTWSRAAWLSWQQGGFLVDLTGSWWCDVWSIICRKCWDPYIIIKARDMIKLMARWELFPCWDKFPSDFFQISCLANFSPTIPLNVQECALWAGVQGIGGWMWQRYHQNWQLGINQWSSFDLDRLHLHFKVRNRERFIKRRQRLVLRLLLWAPSFRLLH